MVVQNIGFKNGGVVIRKPRFKIEVSGFALHRYWIRILDFLKLLTMIL
jgi:hypothetical protein